MQEIIESSDIVKYSDTIESVRKKIEEFLGFNIKFDILTHRFEFEDVTNYEEIEYYEEILEFMKNK